MVSPKITESKTVEFSEEQKQMALTSNVKKSKAIVPLSITCGVLLLAAIGLFFWLRPDEIQNSVNRSSADIYNNNCVIRKDLPSDNNYSGNDYIDIGINPPTELNNKTKAAILAERKIYVANSAAKSALFCAPDEYEPSEYVFGGIVDHKPWMNLAQTCNVDNLRGTQGGIDGVSEESVLLNNPYVLVGLETMFWTDENCSEDQWILPTSLLYRPSSNTFKLSYNWDTVSVMFGSEILLNGLNAIDMGYSWVKVVESRNINFSSDEITTRPYQLQNFIHLGGSCEWEGGCNNTSPYQPQLEFTIECDDSCEPFSNYPYIALKLWRNEPKTGKENPDLYFVIKFV